MSATKKVLAASLTGLLALLLSVGGASAAAGTYSVKTLHFDVVVGPNDDTHCDIIGDLYTPDSASPSHRLPAILTTNGFGGSKDDQADIGSYGAAHGYVVLSYSGLGFGGSGCKITLDDRDWDGKAGSQLVSFLGGGGAAKDGTTVNYVKRDRRGSDGRRHAHDPRVGMIGGSYGGQIQFAIAAIDPRLDTIIPIITWNDLSYSLAPNNTSFVPKTVSTRTPGVEKYQWTSLFFGLGVADGLSGIGADPTRNVGCPNFTQDACTIKAEMDTLGYPSPAATAFARHASVGSFIDKIRIPTMLMQGEGDTLFNLQESVSTYRGLRKRGVPVRLIWQSWGHSDGSPAPGEFGDPILTKTYEGRLVLRWFNHFLRHRGPRPKMNFEFFRDWIHYKGIAKPAYGKERRFMSHPRTPYYLSGNGSLVSARSAVSAGTARLVAPSGGAPSSYSETSAVEPGNPVSDTNGTFASFSTDPISGRSLRLVGIPQVTLNLSAPSNQASQGSDAGKLVLFFKLYDVAPDGSITLPNRLISPVRVPDVTRPLKVQLPGIVHRVPVGHHLELVIAGGDSAYRGNNASSAVTITVDPADPGVLQLPIVPRHHGR